jgi:taurine--2-oxoglutarate transaminase
MAEILASCRKQGLLPFANYNRIHVVPPCNIAPDDARAGLAILDEALSIGDTHVAL